MSITQESCLSKAQIIYNKHDTLLQEQCILMSNNSKDFNSKVYEREWEWCRIACSANCSLAPAFHDFIKEVENESK